MLRLCREALSDVDRVLHHEGQPYTGVLVDVRIDWWVQLRHVVDGLDTGPWFDPHYGGDQSRMLHDAAFEDEQEPSALVWSGEPFTGTKVFILGNKMKELTEVVHGDDLHYRATRWHDDGSVARISEPLVGIGDLSAGLRRQWEVGAAQADPLPVPSEMTVQAGTGGASSALTLKRAVDGSICELRYRGEGHFDRMPALSDTSGLGWYPPTFLALRELGFARHLKLGVRDEGLYELLEGIGGFAVFADVEVLEMTTFGLTPETVSRFLDLPGLREVHLREQERSQPSERNIRGLATDLLRRRGVIVTLDGQDLSQTSNLLIERSTAGEISRLDYRGNKSSLVGKSLRENEFAAELTLQVDEAHYRRLVETGGLDGLVAVQVLTVWADDLAPTTLRDLFALPALREIHLREVRVPVPERNIRALAREEIARRPELIVTFNRDPLHR